MTKEQVHEHEHCRAYSKPFAAALAAAATMSAAKFGGSQSGAPMIELIDP